MNLTSLRKSYSTLLESFKEAGVVLNESQQGNLDQFMIALEKKITETRDTAIQTTKKMVTEKLDKEYKELTEQLIKHMQENAELTAKIQKQVDESKKTTELAEAIDEYLSLYLEEVLPKKQIVDYSRMQKLEKIHESLKSMLQVQECGEVVAKPEVKPEEKAEEEVTEKKEETVEKDDNGTTEVLTEKVQKLQSKLDESVNNGKYLANRVNQLKAQMLLEQKTKDLPDREAKIIRESLKDASVSEINMKFKTLLEGARESVEQEVQDSQIKQEKSLEEAINDIINAETSSKKNNDDSSDEGTAPQETADTDPETDAGADTDLEESMDMVVDDAYMKLWMSRC